MEPKKGLADPLDQLARILGLLRFIAGIRIKTGKVMTPFGNEVNGFEVSFGEAIDPAQVEHNYDDIAKIFKSNPGSYKVSEERVDGKFRRFIVET